MKSLWLLFFSLFLVVSVTHADADAATDTSDGIARAKVISDIIKEKKTKESKSEETSSPNQNAANASTMFQMIKGLAMVAGLFLIAAYLYNRFVLKKVAPQTGRIKIIERTQILPKTYVVLAEIDGEKVLFGAGSDQVSIMNLPSTHNGFIKELKQELGECRKDLSLSA